MQCFTIGIQKFFAFESEQSSEPLIHVVLIIELLPFQCTGERAKERVVSWNNNQGVC